MKRITARFKQLIETLGIACLLVLVFTGSSAEKKTAQPEELTNSLGMKFKLIPAGSFLMGAPDYDKRTYRVGWPKYGGPQHKVTLTQPFYLGVYEVTQEQYEKVMGMNPSRCRGAKQPVETVTWPQAQEFCRKLSELDKKMAYRLPTEAEWEYACRAGTQTVYYWGDTFDGQYAWIRENSEGTTREVGTRKPNAWGLYDMSGNVWEWCSDLEENYPTTEQTDPKGAATGTIHMLRGGAWDWLPEGCRSAERSNQTLTFCNQGVGLRVIAVPGGKMEPVSPENGTKQVEKQAIVIGNGELTNSLGMKFKQIPAGSFLMGASDYDKRTYRVGWPRYGGAQHKVTLTQPFYLGVYEVTQEQYEKVMGTNPSRCRGAKQPVETVTWPQAQEFCQKLSEQEKKITYRLPTEAEWEYACRAGTQTVYYWGDTFDGQYAWIRENSEGTTREVGTRKPNAWGLYDMSGNVWEWCSDLEENYPTTEQTDPKGAATGTIHMLRGGAWDWLPEGCRSAERSNQTLTFCNQGVGFRVIAVPKAGQ